MSLKKLMHAVVSLLLFFVMGVSFAKDNTSVINIEEADSTDYSKNADTGEEEIILKGGVSISVTKGETKTSIKADRIVYSRMSDMLYASGNVRLQQTGSAAGEQDISASTLLFNTNTLEGVFDNGRAVQTQSDAINLPSGSTLIVSSKMFGRDSKNTVAFKNADLTFCDDENPHWKIKASRIWLLPGGEFAFFNAVFYVGHIPVLYLPAFYYPKDELIFNPSFGYHYRRGYYFQTTTYLLGRKPLDTSKSDDENDKNDLSKGLFNFMKPSSLKKQRLEGLVLHNLDEDYTGSTDNYLKLIADYYTTLGYMTGLHGSLHPKSGFLRKLDAGLDIGFSNTVFDKNSNIIPYAPDGEIYRDSSSFIGMNFPFRFSGALEFSIEKPFSLNVTMPFYSDPFFKKDFGERSEYIDWIGFIMKSADRNNEKDKENDTSSNVTSFTWNATGNYSLPVPDALDPYLTTVALSNFTASVDFNSKDQSKDSSHPNDFFDKDAEWQKATPERTFFYPSQITPGKMEFKIAGNFFKYPQEKKHRDIKTPTFISPLSLPALIDPEHKDGEENPETDEKDEGKEKKDPEEKKDVNPVDRIVFPSLTSDELPSRTDIYDLKYAISYSIDPKLTTQVNYDSAKLYKASDFDWNDVYSSYYNVSTPVNVTSNLDLKNQWLNLKNSFLFDPVYQEHPSLKGYSTEESINSVKKSDYEARKLELSNINNICFKPFVYSELLKNTSFSWDTTIKLMRTEFDGTAEDPRWKYISSDLEDEDCVTVNTMTGTFAMTEDLFAQTLTMTSTLPPQLNKYTTTLALDFPFTKFSASTGLFKESRDSDIYKWSDFTQTLNFKPLKWIDFTETYTLNLEDWHSSSVKYSLTLGDFNTAYTMQYAKAKKFYEDKGWVDDDDYKFQPYSLSFSYDSAVRKYYYWFNRIEWAPKLSTSIVYDFINPVKSYFNFIPAITFNIHDEFDLTFKMESQNNIIFRYFQKAFGYGKVVPGEENPFIDLYNSFAFWDDDGNYDPDQQKRKSSAFKLKSISILLTRKLHDWDFNMEFTLKPRTVQDSDGKNKYDYNPYFSVGVSWRPLPSMKTQLVDDYGTWKMNP